MSEGEECAYEHCPNSSFRDGCCVVHFLAQRAREEYGAGSRVRLVDADLGGAYLSDATLSEVTFEGRTSFIGCEFDGETRFENVEFTGFVTFAGATSGGRMAFRDVRFQNLVDLGRTTFAELSIRRSEFEAPVELALGPGTVDVHLTTFAARSRLVGVPKQLELKRVACPAGAELRLNLTAVMLEGVELGAPSSLRPWQPLEEAGDTPANRLLGPRLLKATATDLASFSVSDTDLSNCTFAGAYNLDAFSFDSPIAFAQAPVGLRTRRRVLADEVSVRARYGALFAVARRSSRHWRPSAERSRLPDPDQVARDYRALRKALEDAKDEPGAADFYYGEMEMRRMARKLDMYFAQRARQWRNWIADVTEHTLLWLYWAVSGYGLRAWRALATLVGVLLGASVIFRYVGFPGDTHTYAASLRFAIQSAMSLVRGTDEPLSPTGEWVALALRLLGPLLFGLALLALRGRVRR